MRVREPINLNSIFVNIGRYVQTLLVVFVFIICGHVFATTPKTLTAYFDSYEINISKAQRQKLQGLLSNALSANVVLSPDNVLTDHDIRLSLDMHEQPRWHRALYTLDHVPEFISVSLPDAAQSGLVGQMQGQYQYRQPGLYPVESVSNALTMLRNGRLDSVIDVRSNEFFIE